MINPARSARIRKAATILIDVVAEIVEDPRLHPELRERLQVYLDLYDAAFDSPEVHWSVGDANETEDM